jgi:hypothetical protein
MVTETTDAGVQVQSDPDRQTSRQPPEADCAAPIGRFSLPGPSSWFEQAHNDIDLSQLRPEKAEALLKALASTSSAGTHRRIGGIATTTAKDRRDDRIAMGALDFGPFLEYGAFNDNHSPLSAHVVGAPTEVRHIKQGERLPDGRTSPNHGTWVAGLLYADPHSVQLYEKAREMERLGLRRMGMSVQGDILMRSQTDQHVILSGVVREMAVTHIPTNGETSFEELAKSMLEKHLGTAHEALTERVKPAQKPLLLDQNQLSKIILHVRPEFSAAKAGMLAAAWISHANMARRQG